MTETGLLRRTMCGLSLLGPPLLGFAADRRLRHAGCALGGC